MLIRTSNVDKLYSRTPLSTSIPIDTGKQVTPHDVSYDLSICTHLGSLMKESGTGRLNFTSGLDSVSRECSPISKSLLKPSEAFKAASISSNVICTCLK